MIVLSKNRWAGTKTSGWALVLKSMLEHGEMSLQDIIFPVGLTHIVMPVVFREFPDRYQKSVRNM
jgi:hypothetical protein